MSKNEVVGKMITCSRDGNFVFLKHIRHVPMDGGYSGYEKYEDLPDDWLYGSEFGYLCPVCAKAFKGMMTEFFGEDNIIPRWRLNLIDNMEEQNND